MKGVNPQGAAATCTSPTVASRIALLSCPSERNESNLHCSVVWSAQLGGIYTTQGSVCALKIAAKATACWPWCAVTTDAAKICKNRKPELGVNFKFARFKKTLNVHIHSNFREIIRGRFCRLLIVVYWAIRNVCSSQNMQHSRLVLNYWWH